jgi:hypothetical protein
MPIFGQKTGVHARMKEIKSVIPCSVSDHISVASKKVALSALG